jgi:AraC-like DNA-binding protein
MWQTWSPQTPLSTFVECLWFYQGAVPTHSRERLLPSGEIEIVFNLKDDRIRIHDRKNVDDLLSFRGAVLVGAQSEYFVIDTCQQQCVMGVHFRPGGAFPFLGLPADEVRDQHVSLETLWGAEAIDLRERLLEIPDVETRFHLLERFLLTRALRPLETNAAVAYAIKEFQRSRSVADVCAQIGHSPKRFIAEFSAQVGLTPKLFCRIRRFQKLLGLVHTMHDVDWADVAIECGYFDQPHFIHDFRGFTGLSPSQYISKDLRHRNHVPLLD